jgi:hypothetical protein
VKKLKNKCGVSSATKKISPGCPISDRCAIGIHFASSQIPAKSIFSHPPDGVIGCAPSTGATASLAACESFKRFSSRAMARRRPCGLLFGNRITRLLFPIHGFGAVVAECEVGEPAFQATTRAERGRCARLQTPHRHSARPAHPYANVATSYCPALDMKLFPRLTVGEAQHGDSGIASTRKPGSLTSQLSLPPAPLYGSAAGSQHRTGRCCHPSPSETAPPR